MKYKNNCKNNILYTAVDNEEDVKLTTFQKFVKLPMVVISTITDHAADFAVIGFYFNIGLQELKQNDDWQILSWGIISLTIWIFSNCAQAMIQNKRLKDIQNEDVNLKLLTRKMTPAEGTRFQIKRKTTYNHLLSFVCGPILNVVNLYRTKPNKRLISYKGVIKSTCLCYRSRCTICTTFFIFSFCSRLWSQTSTHGATENNVDHP